MDWRLPLGADEVVAFQAAHGGIDGSAGQAGHLHDAETVDEAGADGLKDHGGGVGEFGFGGHGSELYLCSNLLDKRICRVYAECYIGVKASWLVILSEGRRGGRSRRIRVASVRPDRKPVLKELIMLEVQHLYRSFRGIPAVEDVSFRIAPGRSSASWARTAPANRPP